MQFPRALPLAIFLLVMAVALLSVIAIERVEERSETAQLREKAGAISSALERRANANSAYLRAGAALFATLGDVPPGRFRRFVSELRLDADYRGAEGFGWAQRVDPDQVEAFNRQLAQEYGEGAELHPIAGPDQEFAVPVTLLEPDTERNHRALGYDMFSEPVRRAAMVAAERTARPTASGKVVLVQEGGGDAPGFLIYMPVFDAAPDGARLRGFVYSAFNAQDFLSSALMLTSSRDLAIRIYDQEVSDERLLTSTSGEGKHGAPVRETVMVAGHPWILEVTSPAPNMLSRLSIATLIAGFAAACMLALVARMLTQQAREDGARLSWFEEQNAIRDSLTRELNHRVKNTLANVLSIVALTRRRASSLDEFAEGLDGRIRALSATHDLLTRSDWGSTPVRAVIEAELAPYWRDLGPTIALDGPHVELAPNDALSLGLALHELATNAAKYGSLSVPGGKLSIVWKRTGDGQVRIDWVETDGPPVPEQRERGFGTDLIEKIVAHELQNPVDLLFDPEGVRCRLTVPVREARPFAIRKEA